MVMCMVGPLNSTKMGGAKISFGRSTIVFDKFDCVFLDNGHDLQYKKQNWFLECQKFLIFWGT